MIDRTKLGARLDAALARAKAARSDGQRAENEALDLMIQIGTFAEAERDAAVIRAEMAEAELAQLRQDARAALGRWHVAAVTGVAARLPGLDEDEAEALTESAARSADMDDHDLHRALRSVLGLADLPESDQT